MTKFVWGKVLDRFEYDFDGIKLEIIKYQPKVLNSFPAEYLPEERYHIEECSASFNTLLGAVVYWITYKQLGLNQHALAHGICRALKIEE